MRFDSSYDQRELNKQLTVKFFLAELFGDLILLTESFAVLNSFHERWRFLHD